MTFYRVPVYACLEAGSAQEAMETAMELCKFPGEPAAGLRWTESEIRDVRTEATMEALSPYVTMEVDPTELLPGDVVISLGDHEESGCHCDVRVTVSRLLDGVPGGGVT